MHGYMLVVVVMRPRFDERSATILVQLSTEGTLQTPERGDQQPPVR